MKGTDFSKLELKDTSTPPSPRVSVVIIFLNPQNYLEEAIESVLAQTCSNWELLLVDDGSTDQSSAVAQGYAQRYPGKIIYLEHAGHRNRGKPASRNLGIQHATGEYLTFLDGDDVWVPVKLEQQIAILEAHPRAAMVYGKTENWYSWTGRPEDQSRDLIEELGTPLNTVIEPPQLFSAFFIEQKYALPSISNFMVRRKVLDEIGVFDGSFTGVNNVYEDQVIFARLALKEPLIASDCCWDRYRQHDASSMATMERSGRAHQTRVFFLNWLAGYLESQGVNDPEIVSGLRREIWLNRHPRLQGRAQQARQLGGKARLLPFRLAYRLLPEPIFSWLKARWRREAYTPPPGWVKLGSLRRLSPFSRTFGFERGRPVDRYYIENFLQQQRADIRGCVLEIAENTYTRQFGGDQVTRSEVLSVSTEDPQATIIGDLSNLDHVPADMFDCVILTQTLQLIFDVPAVLRTVYRLLKPGGVVLVTIPGISHISRYDMDRWGYFWGFTHLSAQRLFEAVFPPDHIHIETHGNILSATAFLYGMADRELKPEELDFSDPDYVVTIAVRAQKPKGS